MKVQTEELSMKRRLLATSALIGLLSLGSAAWAQNDGGAVLSRSQHLDSMAGSLSRTSTPGPAPELEAARPPAGMLSQPIGSSRSFSRVESGSPAMGSAVRNSLRPE